MGSTSKIGRGASSGADRIWTKEDFLERFDTFTFERHNEYHQRLEYAQVTLSKLEAVALVAARELGAESVPDDYCQRKPLFDVRTIPATSDGDALLALLDRTLTIAECKAKLKETEGFYWENLGDVPQDWNDPRVLATARRLWCEFIKDDRHAALALRESKLDFDQVFALEG